jgi:periplasmic protein TonB
VPDAMASVAKAGMMWRRKPTANDIARVYPAGAQRADVDGRAIIQCVVAPTGKLEACRAEHESPGGYAFGAAAVKLGAKFEVAKDVLPMSGVVGSAVRIPIRFTLPR